MNDLSAIGVFFACLIATLGLVRVCDWLRPHEQARKDSGAGTLTKEARR